MSHDGYEPRFDIDSEYGRQGELFIGDVRTALEKGSVEVKRDGRWVDTGRLYVEYECRRNGAYRPSGIATSEAELWAFVLGDQPSAIVIGTDLLRLIVEAAKKDPRCLREETDGSHPTRGVVIDTRWLLQAIQYRTSRRQS